MASTQQDHQEAGTEPATDFDAIIVGAGFSGLYMLHSLRDEMGLSARVYEAGDDIGGTWYWNRYPGAKSDSPSQIYCYSFSEELLQEWEWTETYPGQPEMMSYFHHVADKFDLRQDIQFETRVTSAAFDEETNRWEIRTDAGDVVSARFFIAAVGALSAGNIPDFEGLDTFEGEWYHTGSWPHEGVDFAGKRVGIIGTGATGIQVIPKVAEEAEHLYVFQRTPNFAVPARNRPMSSEDWWRIKENYDEIWREVRHTFAAFQLHFIERSALDDSPEERDRELQARWDQGGFGLWLGNYEDMFFTEEANDAVSEFMREKIRERIDDPEIAEKLIPHEHAFGTKRVPLETGYYDAFNRDNVELVDVREAPIQEITPTGLRTQDGEEYAFDVLVVATGFDAITGPLNNIDIRGRGGELLRDKWAEGPRTYLGLTSADYPNLFFITGPQSPSVLSNMPVSIEQHVEWISGVIRHMRDNGLDAVEPTRDAEKEWSEHAQEVAHSTLFPQSATWYMGANIPGKPQVFLPYLGGVGTYRQKCDEIAANDYEGFTFTT